MASDNSSDKKTSSSVAENVEKIEAPAVNNNTASAASKENIQKSGRIPSPLLKPKEAVGANYVKLSGQQLIGRKVKIWLPQKEMFHKGKIIDFNDEERTHTVRYDNGIMEFLDLSKERWQLVKEKDSGPGPSYATLRSVAMNHTSKRKSMELMTHEGKAKKFTTAIDQKAAPAPPPPAPAPAGPIVVRAFYELVDVHGYQVKASSAPMLGFIFAKYGDIARDCFFKNPHARSLFLEMVCNVVENLQSTEFGVTPAQLREMISDISDAAGANLNVAWLQNFLQAINPAEEVVRDSPELMEQRAASYQLVKAAKEDMDGRKREFMEAEKSWKALKCANLQIEIEAVKSLQAKRAWRRRLDELLCSCRSEA